MHSAGVHTHAHGSTCMRVPSISRGLPCSLLFQAGIRRGLIGKTPLRLVAKGATQSALHMTFAGTLRAAAKLCSATQRVSLESDEEGSKVSDVPAQSDNSTPAKCRRPVRYVAMDRGSLCSHRCGRQFRLMINSTLSLAAGPLALFTLQFRGAFYGRPWSHSRRRARVRCGGAEPVFPGL